jgi:hypothetical protein
MDEKDLMFAIFGVVEYITKAELTNIAKTLMYNYYKGSEKAGAAEKAREVVFRYTQCKSLPRLDEIRKKTGPQLDRLEHLVLKMEFEAKRVDGPFAPPTPSAAQPQPPSETRPYSPPVTPASSLPHPLYSPKSRKTPLVSGSFSGIKVKPPRSRAKTPRHAPVKAKHRRTQTGLKTTKPNPRQAARPSKPTKAKNNSPKRRASSRKKASRKQPGR